MRNPQFLMLTREEDKELQAMGLFQDDAHCPSPRELEQLTKKQYKRMVEIATGAAIRESIGSSMVH
jgi:hypothetical protein